MNFQEKQPSILNDIISFTRWSVSQPYYHLQTFNLEIGDAVFLQDFGPWSKDDKPYHLIFNVFDGTLTEVNNWNEGIKSCKLKIQPE